MVCLDCVMNSLFNNERLLGTGMVWKMQKGTSLFGVRQNDMMRTSSFSQLVSSKDSVFWGWIYVVFGSLFFLCFLYAAIISKLLPPSENVIISAIQNDRTLMNCMGTSFWLWQKLPSPLHIKVEISLALPKVPCDALRVLNWWREKITRASFELMDPVYCPGCT